MTTIAGPGTPEAEWRAWEQLWCRPPLRLPAGRIVVVAPHPDDEVLGLGGLLRLHANCLLVTVTDGQASHPDSTVLSPRQLAATRRGEQDEALARLGRSDVAVIRLGHRDGRVEEDLLVRQLGAVLRAGDVCAATWRHDGHLDHEAVGRGAARAARYRAAGLWEYPVWAWHWARPGDPRVPWTRGRALRLDAATRSAKRRAVSAFRSQIQPLGPAPQDAAVLPPEVLARFDRAQELVFVDDAKHEPRTNVTVPATVGPDDERRPAGEPAAGVLRSAVCGRPGPVGVSHQVVRTTQVRRDARSPTTTALSQRVRAGLFGRCAHRATCPTLHAAARD